MPAWCFKAAECQLHPRSYCWDLGLLKIILPNFNTTIISSVSAFGGCISSLRVHRRTSDGWLQPSHVPTLNKRLRGGGWFRSQPPAPASADHLKIPFLQPLRPPIFFAAEFA